LPNTFQTFVGIDGGSERHRVCIRDWAGELIEQRWIEHSGSSLVERLEWLRTKVGNRPAGMAISIEIPHGAIVETLVENSFAVFSINPKQLDRFRDRYSPAGPRTTGATLGGWPIRCAQICTVFIACGSTLPPPPFASIITLRRRPGARTEPREQPATGAVTPLLPLNSCAVPLLLTSRGGGTCSRARLCRRKPPGFLRRNLMASCAVIRSVAWTLSKSKPLCRLRR
jgi:hypothetical protein